MKPKKPAHLLKYVYNTIQNKWQQNWHLIWVITKHQGVQPHEASHFLNFPDFSMIKFGWFSWFLAGIFCTRHSCFITTPLYHIFDELDRGDFYLLEKHLIWGSGGSASNKIF